LSLPESPAHGIGVFGGTFDPVHIGHLSAVREAGEILQLGRILLVPAGRSPHKSSHTRASAALRLEMLKAAVQGDPLLEVSEVELLREGPSFTVETLEILSRANPGTPLFLLMGVDQWSAFSRWRSPREIARLATIVLMARGGEFPSEVDPGFEDGPPPPFIEVAVTRLDVSSSLVRDRIRSGRSVRYLLPDRVGEIIEREKLYLSE